MLPVKQCEIIVSGNDVYQVDRLLQSNDLRNKNSTLGFSQFGPDHWNFFHIPEINIPKCCFEFFFFKPDTQQRIDGYDDIGDK